MERDQSYDIVQKRLQELRGEYARGQAQMSALKHQQQELHETLLRITGAILILEELSQNQESMIALDQAVSLTASVR